ncbi:hypothetical protein MUK42_32665 [Musa troglodytarum]|uniref:Uncharacterized protein n=1 Tax=Musa troglodytarum TaxID=320322 RepID=A0A9E7EZM6_9LILI|nr:hypothetical protein MUK42_32665 [Musa troglodytarum]
MPCHAPTIFCSVPLEIDRLGRPQSMLILLVGASSRWSRDRSAAFLQIHGAPYCKHSWVHNKSTNQDHSFKSDEVAAAGIAPVEHFKAEAVVVVVQDIADTVLERLPCLIGVAGVEDHRVLEWLDAEVTLPRVVAHRVRMRLPVGGRWAGRAMGPYEERGIWLRGKAEGCCSKASTEGKRDGSEKFWC